MCASKSITRVTYRDFLFLPNSCFYLPFSDGQQFIANHFNLCKMRQVNIQVDYFSYKSKLEPKCIIPNKKMPLVFQLNLFPCASNIHPSGNRRKESSPTAKIYILFLAYSRSSFHLHSPHLLCPFFFSFILIHSLHSFIHSLIQK